MDCWDASCEHRKDRQIAGLQFDKCRVSIALLHCRVSIWFGQLTSVGGLTKQTLSCKLCAGCFVRRSDMHVKSFSAPCESTGGVWLAHCLHGLQDFVITCQTQSCAVLVQVVLPDVQPTIAQVKFMHLLLRLALWARRACFWVLPSTHSQCPSQLQHLALWSWALVSRPWFHWNLGRSGF